MPLDTPATAHEARQTALALARARRAQQHSPGPVFTARDVARHSRLNRSGAQKDLAALRDHDALAARRVGRAYVYWFPADATEAKQPEDVS